MQISRRRLQALAHHCVESMGDVFWDALDFPVNGIVTIPQNVAINAVTQAMEGLAEQLKAVVVEDCGDLPTQKSVQ